MENNGRLIAVDSESGEVLEGARIYTKEQVESHQQHQELKKKVEQFRTVTKDEQFVWSLFNNYKNLQDIKPQTAIRLVYLATYLSYDDNFLKNNGNTITRQKMQSLMALKDTTFREFLKEVTAKKYLLKEHKSYRLNDNFFAKGELKLSSDLSENRAVRLYINAIRKLYLGTPQSKHVYL